MKDNLFELLLNLFEQSLAQLQKNQKTGNQDNTESHEEEQTDTEEGQFLYIKPAQQTSSRVLSFNEKIKLSAASSQFLIKMKLWGILDDQMFELVMNQVEHIDSSIINLQEIKWLIRQVLSDHLDEKQLPFLDLVLYQTPDELVAH